VILKEVFKRYRDDQGQPIDLEDDNIADAVNFNMIGRAVLGWMTTSNEAQKEVVTQLTSPPKFKVRKTSKSKIPKAAYTARIGCDADSPCKGTTGKRLQ